MTQYHFHQHHLIFSLKMQQPANMSGRPVIVLAQTAPIETQSTYINVRSDLAQRFTGLGVTHLVFGALCIIFQSVSLEVGTQRSFSFIGHGMWTGSLVRTLAFVSQVEVPVNINIFYLSYIY